MLIRLFKNIIFSTVCPAGKFGEFCEFTCHCNLGDSDCDPVTGMCEKEGCDPHWSGDTCQGNINYEIDCFIDIYSEILCTDVTYGLL